MPGGGGKGGGGKKGGGGLPPLDVDLTANTNSVVDANVVADTKSALSADTKSALSADTKSALSADTKSALSAEVDFKPFEFDLCVKLGLDPLPSTRICRDVSRHFGITIFGIKIIGFDYMTDTKTVIEDLGQRPFVVGKRSDHHHGVGVQGIRIRVGD
jgi:hypothetical protein